MAVLPSVAAGVVAVAMSVRVFLLCGVSRVCMSVTSAATCVHHAGKLMRSRLHTPCCAVGRMYADSQSTAATTRECDTRVTQTERRNEQEQLQKQGQ